MGKYYRKVIYLVLAVLGGVFIFIYGGYDDSPGAQLLGVVVVFISIASFIKNRKKR